MLRKCLQNWARGRRGRAARPASTQAMSRSIGRRSEAGMTVMNAGGEFADGVMAYEGKWLGGETFVSFDKNAVPCRGGAGEQGQAARLIGESEMPGCPAICMRFFCKFFHPCGTRRIQIAAFPGLRSLSADLIVGQHLSLPAGARAWGISAVEPGLKTTPAPQEPARCSFRRRLSSRCRP